MTQKKHLTLTRPVDLIIIGSQKAGTSSLLRYLGQHPQICAHRQPEMNFFIDDNEFRRGYADAFKRYFQFNQSDQPIFLAKSVGILDSAKFMERVYQHNADAQIIVVLRNPVDRAYSAYWFARRKGWEGLKSFEDAIDANPSRFAEDDLRRRECAYLDRGIYINQLLRLYEYFPRQQIDIFLMADIINSLTNVCQLVYTNCGIDNQFEPILTQKHNMAAVARSDFLARMMVSFKPLKKAFRSLLPNGMLDNLKVSLLEINQKKVEIPAMNAATRIRLIEYFKPFNDQLGLLINQDLTHWKS